MTFADKINKLRKEKNVSQEEIAEKLGVSRQSVSKWESGYSLPELNKVVELADYFNVSVDYLVRDNYSDILADTGKNNGEQKSSNERAEEQKLPLSTFEWFIKLFWSSVVAIYLLFSFLTKRWDISWVIWPISGVLFPIISTKKG